MPGGRTAVTESLAVVSESRTGQSGMSSFISVPPGHRVADRSAATALCRCALAVPGAMPRSLAVVYASRSNSSLRVTTSR